MYSLGEIRALSYKAARGGGLSWGDAQEAAFAAELLLLVELPGPSALCKFLNTISSFKTSEVTSLKDIDRNNNKTISGLTYGTTFLDFQLEQKRNLIIATPRIASPLLLLGVLLLLLRSDTYLEVKWEGFEFSSKSVAPTFSGKQINPDLVDCVEIQIGEQKNSIIETKQKSFTIPQKCFFHLNEFASKTYVPASASSRAMGAGAGLLDND